MGFIQSLSSYFIPELITEFTEAGYNHEVQFLFNQSSTESMVSALKSGKIDIAFCSFIANEPDLEFVRLREQELVLIVSCDHPLAAKDAVNLREIAPYPFIAFSKESGLRAFIEKTFSQLGLEQRRTFEADDEIAIAGLVAHNKGVAIAPSLPFLSYLRIKMIPIVDWPEKRFMYLTTLRDGYKAPIVQAFYDFCLERLK